MLGCISKWLLFLFLCWKPGGIFRDFLLQESGQAPGGAHNLTILLGPPYDCIPLEFLTLRLVHAEATANRQI